MPTINYSGTVSGTNTFVSTDTVTFTGATTVTGSIQKTDALGMTIYVASGVTVQITTGWMDIQGARAASGHAHAWVIIDSNAAIPQAGDWAQFWFSGTSTNNTMKWVITKNSQYGILFSGHSPAEDKFEYIGGYNHTYAFPCGFVRASGGNMTVTDIFAVKCAGLYGLTQDNAGGTATIKRMMVLEPYDTLTLAANVTRNLTLEDCYFELPASSFGFATGSTYTLTLTRCYLNRFGGTSGTFQAGAGATVATDCIFRSPTRNMYFSSASSTCSMTGCDCYEGIQYEFLYGGHNNCFTLSDCAIFGSNDADRNQFDTSTATPNSGEAVPQYRGAVSVSSPRSTRKFQHSFSSISAGTPTSEAVTITATAGIICKARVVYWKTSVPSKRMSTDWDAPDVYIDAIYGSIPCIVSDFGESGKKYSTSKSLELVELDDNESYTYILEGMSPMGDVFRSGENTFSTAAGAGGGMLVHAGMSGGMRG